MSELLERSATEDDPAVLVERCGPVLARFDHLTQDSGNVSWLVRTPAGDLFVKSAGLPAAAPPDGAPVPYLGHHDRVRLLRNAVDLARSSDHHCLSRLLNVIESGTGPLLVYQRAVGDLIGTTRSGRADPTSAYQRFAHLPASRLLAVFDDLIDLHRDLAGAGWVAGDLYDGCLIVDLAIGGLTVIDLDSYRRGPGTNTVGRMFGATRFMAPEEFELGAALDQRTTVFTLGRLVWHFATRLTERAEEFCGPLALRAVVERAVRPEPPDRFPSAEEFSGAWREARAPSGRRRSAFAD